jgi:hypothetical protein
MAGGAAQDDIRRIAFELHRKELANSALFYLVAQPHELGFPLVRFSPLSAFKIIHGGGADSTWYISVTIHHGKQDHHPVRFITAKAAACQRHLSVSSALSPRWLNAFTNGKTPSSPYLFVFAVGGLISAILRRQSASEWCGPETNVPLTFVLYRPDTTPSRSASSVLTWRGERFCVGLLSCARSTRRRTLD